MWSLNPVVLLAILGACTPDRIRTDAEFETAVAEMSRSDVMTTAVEPRPNRQPEALTVDTLRRTVTENEGFGAAVSRYREAQANVALAASGQRPRVTGSLTTGGVVENSESNFGAGSNLNIVQTLFDGGETAATIDAASARAFAAKTSIEVTGNDIGRGATVAWIDVWQFNARIDLLNARVAELEPWLSRIEQLIASGIVNRSVLNEVERQILDVRLEEESLRASLLASQERFERYFGFRPDRVPAPPRLFSAGEVVALRNLWQDAPALAAAAAELIAAESDISIATATTRPNVGVRVGVDSPLSDTSDQSVSAGVVVEYTFSDGGQRQAQITAREERLQSLRGDFEDTKRVSLAEVEAGIAQYQSIGSSLSLLDRQIEVTRAERSDLERQLGSGQSSVQQVVEAEIRIYQAEARRLALVASQRTLEVELGSQTGRLLPQLQINVDGIL